MTEPRLSKLELQIMDKLWARGESSIREIQEDFPEKGRPGYTTIQMTMSRMETKKIVRRVRKVGNFHIFVPMVTRQAAQGRLVDELIALFGGQPQPVMARLVETGKLTREDIKDAERMLRRMERGEAE